MTTPDTPSPSTDPDSAPGGQGDATSEAVWRDRGEIIARLQSQVAHLERECLDRESSEADARSRLGVAEARVAELEAEVAKWSAAERRMADMYDMAADQAAAAEAAVARVEALAVWFESQPNWVEWGIHRQIRAALAAADPAVSDGEGATSEAAPCPLDAGSRPFWMSVDQYDPCKCLLTKGHKPPCVCSHTAPASPVAPSATDEGGAL